MKKLFYSLALVAFLASLTFFSVVRAEDSAEDVVETNAVTANVTSAIKEQAEKKLEKIPTPAQIYLYEKIEKMGTALWGIKKDMNKIQNKIENKIENKLENKLENKMPANDRLLEDDSLDGKLEKIASPDQIKLYEKIKKVGTALWGVRKNVASMINPKPVIVNAETSACVISAIDVKDKALQEKVSSSAESLNAAIALRSACQQQAVKSTEKQKDALDSCVKAFREEHKKINESAKRSQRDIWEAYKTSLKSCRPVATSTSATGTDMTKTDQGVIMIEDGSENVTDTILKIEQE